MVWRSGTSHRRSSLQGPDRPDVHVLALEHVTSEPPREAAAVRAPLDPHHQRVCAGAASHGKA